MDAVFEQLRGFQILQEKLKSNGLRGRVYLSPTEEVNEKERHLNGWGVYRFVLITEEIKGPSTSVPNSRKLN